MQVNRLEAKSRLSSLVAPVERGEEVPQVRINLPGAWKGLVAHSPTWNSAETQAQVEDLFLGDGDET